MYRSEQTEMAMHVALSIPELLASIIGELADDNAALACSAQCCKAFLNPSLDILWAHLRSVRPLQRLLPTLYGDNGSLKEAHIKPSEDDWIRFDFYATRIMRITHVEPRTWEDLISLWRTKRDIFSFFCEMAAFRPEVISFPRLRQLKLSADIVLNEFTTWALLPPSLRVLQIQIIPNMQIVKPGYSTNPGKVLLRDAARFVPSIQSLDVEGELSSECLLYITHFKRLRVLNLSGIRVVNGPDANDAYHQLLHALSISDYLVELHLSMVDVRYIPASTGFLNLEVLDIGRTPSVVKQFLGIIAGSKLRAIRISTAGEPGSYGDWRQCLEYLSSQCKASLRSIDLQVDLEDYYDRSFVQFLEPIMKLGNLEDITLCMPLYASNQDVHEMASAWPKMKSFQLRYPITLEKPFHTIESLSSFAQLCPDLRTLAFEINQHELPDVSELQTSPSHHRLNVLALSVRNNVDYKRLAIILDAIFPALERVAVNPTIPELGVGIFAANWSGRGDVPQFINEFQAKRRLESCIEIERKDVGEYATLSRKFRSMPAAGCNEL